MYLCISDATVLPEGARSAQSGIVKNDYFHGNRKYRSWCHNIAKVAAFGVAVAINFALTVANNCVWGYLGVGRS